MSITGVNFIKNYGATLKSATVRTFSKMHASLFHSAFSLEDSFSSPKCLAV